MVRPCCVADSSGPAQPEALVRTESHADDEHMAWPGHCGGWHVCWIRQANAGLKPRRLAGAGWHHQRLHRPRTHAALSSLHCNRQALTCSNRLLGRGCRLFWSAAKCCSLLSPVQADRSHVTEPSGCDKRVPRRATASWLAQRSRLHGVLSAFAVASPVLRSQCAKELSDAGALTWR